MKPRISKTIRRLLSGTVLFLLIALTGVVTLLFFPQPMFANKLVHKNFVVYSSDEIPDAICRILDGAYGTIEACELNDPTFKFDLFLAHGNPFNRLDDLQGSGAVARATAGSIIFKTPVNFAYNEAYTARSRINLEELLIHEMVHVLQTNRYGMLRFNPWSHPPLWKLEGYPEYVARQDRRIAGYKLSNEIGRYVTLRAESTDGWVEVVPGHFMPAVYYKGRLMVEYLMDIKGLSYDEILSSDDPEDEVFNEMLRWSEEQRQAD